MTPSTGRLAVAQTQAAVAAAARPVPVPVVPPARQARHTAHVKLWRRHTTPAGTTTNLLHLARVEHRRRVLAHCTVDQQLQQLHDLCHVVCVFGVRRQRPSQHRQLVAEAQQHLTARWRDIIVALRIIISGSVICVHAAVLKQLGDQPSHQLPCRRSAGPVRRTDGAPTAAGSFRRRRHASQHATPQTTRVN